MLFLLLSLEGRGAERVSLSLASHFDRRRFEPVLWVLQPTNDLQGEVPPDAALHVALAPGERIRHRPLRVWGTLLREARRADVILATVEFTPTHLAYFAGLLTRRPVIGWVRNDLDRVLAEFPAWDNGLPRWVYRHLRQIVCVSRGIGVTLRNRYGLRGERLRVIYNPLDLPRIERLRDEPLPEWAAFMRVRPTVLGVGRVGHQKGFDLLIEAHARVRARGVEHDLLILGKGDDLEGLRALARSLGVEESVHLPGYVPNPYPFMAHATVFALSSRYEGFANVVTEALACGAPVVSFDCPSGPGEILEGGRYGVLVPPEDVPALAGALGALLTDPARRERLRGEGRGRARDFAPEHIVPQWERVLLDTAEGR